MIKVGIIGLGGMGTVHYRNYQYIDDCKVLAAVCHSEGCQQQAQRFNLTPYTDLKSLVNNEDVDVIDICTPTHLHKEHVLEALHLDKHVIVEKPIALKQSDAEEMFALAQEKNLLLFVGHVVQFAKETQILREAIQSQRYGKVLDAYFRRVTGRPRWSRSGWLLEKTKSGVVPFDLHVHDLDLLISLFGEPLDFNYTSSGSKYVDYEEIYRINYQFADLNVMTEAAWFGANYPFLASWRVYFEEGVLEFDGEKLFFYEMNRSPVIFDLSEEIVVAPGINLPPTGMFYKELSHFLTCIREGKPSELVNAEQVIAGVKIMEKLLAGDR